MYSAPGCLAIHHAVSGTSALSACNGSDLLALDLLSIRKVLRTYRFAGQVCGVGLPLGEMSPAGQVLFLGDCILPPSQLDTFQVK